MCTRFLYAVLPSELYWGEQSLKHLNVFFANNLADLYEKGVTVAWLKIMSSCPALTEVLLVFRIT